MNKKIGFIGGGNMAQAIIGGLLAQGFANEQILVSEPFEATQDVLKSKGIALADDNASLVADVDVVVIAVKPQMASDVLRALAGQCHDKLVISIMAGVEVATISQLLGGAERIVRVMPNTPALVQQGANGAYAANISEQDRALATQILQATGLVCWVKQEQDIDAVTAVSGSGPAYFFYVMEHMIQAGKDLGLDAETATQLTLQTALGAAQMAINSEHSPTQLRKNVTSPNGTTQAAIETFDAQNVGQGIEQGLAAAAKRSQELAEMLRN